MNYEDLDKELSNLLNDEDDWMFSNHYLYTKDVRISILPEYKYVRHFIEIWIDGNRFEIKRKFLPLTDKAYEIRRQKIVDKMRNSNLPF